MTEVKKLTKIALIVVAIIPFLYGLMLVFLWDLTLNTEGWTNPLHPRLFGGICFIGSLFAIIMLRKKEWEQISLTFMFFIAMFLATLIIEATIIGLYISTFNARTIFQSILDLILLSIMVAFFIISYIKQRS
ncbi:MAG: hypothetical protein ACFFBY_12085 [Promethearchaeota archaeon]